MYSLSATQTVLIESPPEGEEGEIQYHDIWMNWQNKTDLTDKIAQLQSIVSDLTAKLDAANVIIDAALALGWQAPE
jgi:hypothetical protein